MKILTKEDFIKNQNKYIQEIKSGKIFIYPTDTIYGIGCNALLYNSILRIRMIKNRDNKPFSIIAPSKKWIKNNCETNQKVLTWLDKLPGKYTLILRLKNKNSIAKEINNNMDSLGVRIPSNWFSEIISKADIPFVTTSVNLTGDSPAFSLETMKEEIKNQVDYIIYEGKLDNSPSTIVNLILGEEIIKR